MTRTQIKSIRKTLRLSLGKFGALTGYSKQYVYMIEKGKEPVTECFRGKVFEALKSHIIELETLVRRIINSSK